MLNDRIELYNKIEELRSSKLIVYCTSDRRNAETQISQDVLIPFANQLDAIGDVDKITLFLYSNGGSILAGWSLVNLIRSFCKEFEIIVPFRCQSTATLICLGANRIVMTKQATLGPIDPSLTSPLNTIENNGESQHISVSVEHVNAFINMAKHELLISDSNLLKDIYLKLADKIHPLSIGSVYKSNTQIKMLAEKLLKYHDIEPHNIDSIVKFLCSESGSHDYTINRREARDELGLNIETPTDELYKVIKSIYQSIENEMELRVPFNPQMIASSFTLPEETKSISNRRVLIESISGGCDVYTTDYIINTLMMENNQRAFNNSVIFDGWKHERN